MFVAAVEMNFCFVGDAGVVLQFVSTAWKKIFGECHVMELHGSAQTVVSIMDLVINDIFLFLSA